MIEAAPIALPFVLLGASWVGWRVQRALPSHHRTRETVDAIRLVLGMLVTFAALVLGLLTSGAKGHFDLHQRNLQTYGIDLIAMDLRLREYGAEGDAARATLRSYTAAALADTWPNEPQPAGSFPRQIARMTPGSLESPSLGTMLLHVDQAIAGFSPANPLQQRLLPLLMSRMEQTLQDRWILIGSAKATISWPFFAVMVAWLVLVFAIFGLSAPANGAVYAVIGVAALSLSMAVYLIVDFDTPLTGVLKASSAPLRDALVHMDVVDGK